MQKFGDAVGRGLGLAGLGGGHEPPSRSTFPLFFHNHWLFLAWCRLFDRCSAELLSVVFGGPLPESVTIYPPFFTEYGLNTTFGENVFVNQGCTFMDKGGIRIGNGVMIAPKVSLITGGHPLPLAERREYLSFAPIVIEDDVWIGTAGAVVTRDVPARTVVAGVPARVIKKID
ncbi:LbetaH domain-containing protein [Streptomyces rimosus]|uniref:sugar O-acetyltransferase n=1 Tax=Streptomyces rimosus TaxID=1927 RepID=UPI001F160DB9|nr:sugar O-acetyltransferase [Streptomyces rimosus]